MLASGGQYGGVVITNTSLSVERSISIRLSFWFTYLLSPCSSNSQTWNLILQRQWSKASIASALLDDTLQLAIPHNYCLASNSYHIGSMTLGITRLGSYIPDWKGGCNYLSTQAREINATSGLINYLTLAGQMGIGPYYQQETVIEGILSFPQDSCTAAFTYRCKTIISWVLFWVLRYTL